MASRISPTAHYTGHVWVRHGLADPRLDTTLGHLLYGLTRPFFAATELALSGASLERYLIERHRMLDLLLERAIRSGRVGQVLEVAAGLSPRGYRFARRFADRITYVEADLPPMAARKRSLLRQHQLTAPNHQVVALDLLGEGGAVSLEAVAERTLAPDRGTAIITEGLLSYFERSALASLWPRLGRVLGAFPHGLFLSNVELGDEAGSWLAIRAFTYLLGRFAKAPVNLVFADARQAESELAAAGFAEVALHRPRDLLPDAAGPLVMRVIEAWTPPHGALA